MDDPAQPKKTKKSGMKLSKILGLLALAIFF